MSIFLLAACSPWAAGDDPRGADLKRQMDLVFDAAVKYNAVHGTLPDNAAQLVPTFITQLPADVNPQFSRQFNSIAFNYKPTWPAMGRIDCSRSLQEQTWHCVGHL